MKKKTEYRTPAVKVVAIRPQTVLNSSVRSNSIENYHKRSAGSDDMNLDWDE